MTAPASGFGQQIAHQGVQSAGQNPLLRVDGLTVEFPAGVGRKVHAVSGVSFDVHEGETLGLVGESGCGKSTTGKAIVQLVKATGGKVVFEGADLTSLHGEELRGYRRQLQMIFQDPISSLNPRRRVRDIVAEPLRIWGVGDAAAQEARVREHPRLLGRRVADAPDAQGLGDDVANPAARDRKSVV